MRMLITGGAGFIGSNYVKFVLKKYPENKVVVFDKLTYAGNLNNLKEVENNKNYSFVKGDICDKKLVEKTIKDNDIDAIVNFAAETHVDRSIIEAGSFVLTDVFGTYTLLEASRKFDINKLIQISTDEIYGSTLSSSFRETDKLDPTNPYSASKAGGDLLTQTYWKTYELPIMITRSSNNYGPNQYPEKFIPKLIINTILNKPLPIYGDGKNVRDWIFVEDNCTAIDVVLTRGKNGEVYNIGGENERTNIEVARLILNQLKKPESLITFVKDRLAHDRRYSLDCTKIKKLGWKPKTKFEEGIRKTISWYANNEWWWKPMMKDVLEVLTLKQKAKK